MLKWKILAVLELAFGVAGIRWGYAQEKKAVGFFELRVYTAQPGKRDALQRRSPLIPGCWRAAGWRHT